MRLYLKGVNQRNLKSTVYKLDRVLLKRNRYRPFDLPSGRRVVSSDRRQSLQVS